MLEQTQRPPPMLETLPFDVKICLLKSMPTKRTLDSLLSASNSYAGVYSTFEDLILTEVMIRDLNGKGYKTRDVLELQWEDVNGLLVLQHLPDHRIIVLAIRALYELENQSFPRRIIEKEMCQLLLRLHRQCYTTATPPFLGGVLDFQKHAIARMRDGVSRPDRATWWGNRLVSTKVVTKVSDGKRTNILVYREASEL